MKCIATRPRAERFGSHGLFSDDDTVSLDKAMTELENYTGNVWTHIISLKREDAERLGYNNASAWRDLLRAHRNQIADAIKIHPNDFRWYASFHDEGHHPHVHMMAWSAKPGQVYLTVDGIKQIRSKLTNDIFRDKMHHLYEQNSESRDELVHEARKAMLELAQQMKSGICDHPEAENLMLELAMQLQHIEGKKSYGYLPKKQKALVDKIVDQVERIKAVCECYVVGYKENGYPITKSVFAKTKTECKQKLKEAMEQAGKLSSDAINPEMTFGDRLQFWYNNYCKPGVRESTRACYEGRIKLHILPSLGHIKLNKLTENALQQFYTNLKKGGHLNKTDLYGPGLSDRMVRPCHATCRTALEKAKEMHLISRNPAIGRKLPPKKAREMQVLTPDEIQRFLIQAKEDGYYEMFLLELCSGMRRGELLALEWRDLNFKTGELRIDKQVTFLNGQTVCSKPKTKESMRTIVLPQSLVEVLKEYRKTVDSKLMFPSPPKGGDEYRNPCSVGSTMRLILDRAGCKHVRFHEGKHS